MKKINLLINNLILISIFAAFGCVTLMAQDGVFTLNPVKDDSLAEETRPFDFSDKFYYENGVEPSLIANRRTGEDNFSVFSKIGSENYSNVRITQVLPAYNYDGGVLYFNLYGELTDASFVGDETGKIAVQRGETFPMFVFPSTTVKNSNRQASVIQANEEYFKANPLGLSMVVEVEYTSRTQTDDNNPVLLELAKQNGTSLDGTPIIKTVDEINYLTRMGLVTQTVKGIDRGARIFVIAKAIQNPANGAIAPDAFLTTVLDLNGKPLEAETIFVDNFNCLQSDSKSCAGTYEIQQ